MFLKLKILNVIYIFFKIPCYVVFFLVDQRTRQSDLIFGMCICHSDLKGAMNQIIK